MKIKKENKLQNFIKNTKTIFYKFRCGSVIEGSPLKQNNNLTLYYNYMKNTVGTPKEQWGKVKTSIIYPSVLIPLIIGLGSIIPVLTCEITWVKMLFTGLSSIGLGVGVNYFTFYLKEQTEFKLLKYKGEHTVRILNDKIEKLILKQTLTNDDKNDITDFLSLIDYWKEYVEFADTSKISYHKRLESEIKLETNDVNKELLISKKESLERNWVNSGVGSFTTISGSPVYEYYKPEETPQIIVPKQTNRMGDFKEPFNKKKK